MTSRNLAFLGLLLILATSACAGNKPSPELQAWYDQQTDQWVESVIISCRATRSNYESGVGPVNCRADYPEKIHMSFPNYAFLKENVVGIDGYMSNWCRSVAAKEGLVSSFTWEFREEGVTKGGPCKTPSQYLKQQAGLTSHEGPSAGETAEEEEKPLLSTKKSVSTNNERCRIRHARSNRCRVR